MRNRTCLFLIVIVCVAVAGCSGRGHGNAPGLQRQQGVDGTVGDEAVPALAAYVAADRLNVRLAPSLSAKVVSVLDRGQRVDVLGVQGGWSRISRYYGGLVEGTSRRVARWVASAYLSDTKPAGAPVRVSSYSPALVRAIDKSDDAHKYRSRFLVAAWELISRQRCTIADFERLGGWTRSTARGKAVYVTYCGGLDENNRIYLDVISGKTFRPGTGASTRKPHG